MSLYGLYFYSWDCGRLPDRATKSEQNTEYTTYVSSDHTLELKQSSKFDLWLSMCGYDIIMEQWKQHGKRNIILAIKMGFSSLCIIDFLSFLVCFHLLHSTSYIRVWVSLCVCLHEFVFTSILFSRLRLLFFHFFYITNKLSFSLKKGKKSFSSPTVVALYLKAPLTSLTTITAKLRQCKRTDVMKGGETATNRQWNERYLNIGADHNEIQLCNCLCCSFLSG